MEEHELSVVVFEEKVIGEVARPYHLDPTNLLQMGGREGLW